MTTELDSDAAALIAIAVHDLDMRVAPCRARSELVERVMEHVRPRITSQGIARVLACLGVLEEEADEAAAAVERR